MMLIYWSCVATAFSATMVEFHRGGQSNALYIQKVQRSTKGKKGKCFGDASFTRLGTKKELHIHLLVWLSISCALQQIDQASNKAEEAGVLHKEGTIQP